MKISNDDDLIIKPEPPKAEPRVIRQRSEFVADGLGKVVRLTVEYMTIPEMMKHNIKPVEYEGYTVVGVPTNGGVYQVPVQFPIEADSVAEAFDKFEALAKAEFEKNMQEAEEAAKAEASKVRAYSAMPPVPGIIQ